MPLVYTHTLSLPRGFPRIDSLRLQYSHNSSDNDVRGVLHACDDATIDVEDDVEEEEEVERQEEQECESTGEREEPEGSRGGGGPTGEINEFM